ncbi:MULTISPECIES: hypothetical protein [Streptomyces]|uniref:Uncharacterized protein n=2 Tax=Streptomyces fradiae TaxID=1906 RepID=A0ABQ6XLX3_STRFR|nr:MULTISPECIES: hypothetical protein [Streptomyces]KAF0646310.1 hypothetical protein K701_29540 [Streptomyces fradiae ATCC 10745 = DSM 40063]
MQNTTTITWPEGVIARYLTVAGTALAREDLAVDVETLTTVDHDEPYATRSTCRGCATWDERDYGLYRNYHGDARTRASQDDARSWAQQHAETCRALPRPA